MAGDGGNGFSGDNVLATATSLKQPEGVAVDALGNFYIADTLNDRIRMVSSSGIITTVAGDGHTGFSGDGGPATSAQLKQPGGVAVDALGNLYIADTGNDRIRMVSSSGIITTVAGNAHNGFSGDNVLATATSLNQPEGVAVDALGNFYIADTHNDRIRMVSSSGIITTVAGDGHTGFSGDGGPAILAQLKQPGGVAVDISGSFYIADTHNDRIRFVDTSSPSPFAPSSGPSSKPTSCPSSAPTKVPTYAPTTVPTGTPTAVPTAVPSSKPSSSPNRYPSNPKCDERRKL